jgi:hypothetical protein
MSINRREFVAAGALPFCRLLDCHVVALPGDEIQPRAPVCWINPGHAALPSRPWRKIHLDFHNSQHIPRIGRQFDPDEFGDTLMRANVNAIVVFAKDMHGYFYYPSKFGPVHPGLSFDLLKAQVASCRKRGIAVHAYYCTTWDNYLAAGHPEWLVIRRDGTTYMPKPDQTPGWTALCLAHEDFVRLEVDHAREFVGRYEIDGAWFDMPVPVAGECFCPECLRQIRGEGKDPFDTKVQREHKQVLHEQFIRLLKETVTTSRPGCQADFNGQGVYGLARRVPAMDNVDIEALPTAFWGYFYFPLIVRYVRPLGVTAYGMTGRFLASWADFGGLKQPVQLHAELASIVANGARCDIGDQMPPGGRLDVGVYQVIGEAYERIRSLEPYLEQATPVTEAALITAGLPLDSPATDANFGLVKLLLESHIQFDVVEPDAEWERYGLVLLADDLEVDPSLARRLHTFLDKGRAAIVGPRSGLFRGNASNWLERYGLRHEGVSPFAPAFMIPQGDLARGIPPYEYALYEGASQWQAGPPAEVLAYLGEPFFQRSPEHYTSHAQTPFARKTDFAAIARSGGLVLFAFPLGISYFNRGYWVYRHCFQRVLETLLSRPLVQTDAPMSSEITLLHQKAAGGRKERFLVHVVNFSALRRTPKHPEFLEDPVPLTNVKIRLNLPFRPAAAQAVSSGTALELREAPGGGVEVSVPSVRIHEIVCFQAE